MCSRAWGYLCGILLMESIFGCDLIFTTFPLWELALHSSTAWSRERKREPECYRSPDKDCSHCQVSRPGQLNTGGDPSTYAHPWDRDLEKRDGNRRGCQRVRFKVSSLWRQLICWKRYKVNNIKVQQDIIFSFAANVQACLLCTIMHEWQRMSF